MFNNQIIAGSSGQGGGSFYPNTIDQSLRFEDGDSSYLGFTPSSSTAGTWTVSFWVKRGKLGATQYIYYSGAVSARGGFYFLSDDRFGVSPFNSSGANMNRFSVPVYRDPSAWYHIVITANGITTSNLSTNLIIYVNGVAIETTQTSLSSASGGDRINDAQAKRIASLTPSGGSYFDGYLAEWHWIDGTVYDQSNFGEFKDGVWTAKEVTGLTYGAAGYYLDFADSSDIGNNANTTDGTNDWSVSGLAASDVVLDSPTNSFCVYNPLDQNTGTLSEGNLKVATASTSSVPNTRGTFGVVSGKWYWEIITVDSASSNRIHSWVGLASTERTTNTLAKIVLATGAGRIYGNSGNLQTGLTEWSQNDVIGVALDVDNTSVQFYRNGSTYGSAVDYSSFIPATEFLTPFLMDGASNIVCTTISNFGQDSTFAGTVSAGGNADGNGVGDFAQSVPSGYLALCASNLPETTIGPNSGVGENRDDYFNTVLYTGDGTSSNAITGVGFQPDWVWLKQRNGTQTHQLLDIVRGKISGAASFARLRTDTTAAEATPGSDSGLLSLDSDGFTLGTDAAYNQNTSTYGAWNWKAGGATPSKTYKVVVVSDSGNKYRFRNSADDATFAASAVTLNLQEGGTYVFDWSDSTAQGHPVRFSTTSDGTHGGGSEYTTGVVKDDSAYTTTITVASGAPALYYYCQIHSGMGGAVNTNSTYGSTNFDGNITSNVTVSKTSGFSIATFTMPDAQKIIGHGLDVKPDMIIFKLRSTGSWMVWHNSFGEDTNNVILLNSTAGKVDSGGSAGNWFRGITTTTTEIKSAGSYAGIGDYVMYSFANVAGYQTVGSYVGNGSSDGTFVFTNFAVKFLLIKRSDSTSHWTIIDSTRSPHNVSTTWLAANLTSAESSLGNNSYDLLSNGFKARDTLYNVSGATYIYLAIGDSFKYANAR